ncbi:MAG: hypothetical protein JXQ79_03850 [Rhodobacteraceae bacterium]|nr:hypothetical protein [Paracoccaceae bacterium]
MSDQRAQAIDLWLADQELDGLQGLALLAQQGDAQSQLLLGLIDKFAELQGAALVAMPRAERLALLRAPGGMSGRNWVHFAAQQGDAIAVAWTELWSMDAGLDTAKALAALDEPRALAETLITLVKRHESGFPAEVLAQDWYPQTLLMLSENRVLRDEDAAKLHPGDPQHRFGTKGAPEPEALHDWLVTSAVARPIRAVCAAQCPDQQQACTMALYKALGSYEGLLTHASPVNALIAEDRFVDSPRGQAALARRIMLMRSTRMREAEREKLAQISLCAADWLGAQFDAHTVRKIPAPQ